MTPGPNEERQSSWTYTSRFVEEAESLERDYDFRAAYRRFLKAFDEYRDSKQDEDAFLALVRAGLSLERFQNWRALSALWEMTGNRLGDAAYPGHTFPLPHDPGQSGMFHIISWTKWKDPEAGYYRNDEPAKRKHQQYWAYLWAAEALEAERHYRGAAKNYRKAGLAAQFSSFGDRTQPDEDGYWTTIRVERKRGLKYRFAAECYFKAIKNHIAAHGVLRHSYKAVDALWYGPTSGKTDGHEMPLSDLQRLHDCWHAFREVRTSVGDKEGCISAFEEEVRELQEIQHLLRTAGNDSQARYVFWQRRHIELKLTPWPKCFGSWLKYLFLDASNVIRISLNSLAFVVITFIIFPYLYLSQDIIQMTNGTDGPSISDAILQSCAATVAVSIPEIAPAYYWGHIVSVGQSFLFYFFLIYMVYVYTKKPED